MCKNPLCCAAMEERFAAVTCLRRMGANPEVADDSNMTPLHHAMFHDFGSLLQYACAFGQDETVKMLLHYKPNLLFNEVNTPLQASICADPNGGPDEVKALPLAAELGETQIIKLLVEAGADPNVTSIYGIKPVEEAARHGNRQGVEILFPVTSPIPSYVDWTIDGVMMHANSEKATSAFRRNEYRLAVYWYTQ
ncbi:hypothetical protein MKX01_027942, partial [Papaver californicum]